MIRRITAAAAGCLPVVVFVLLAPGAATPNGAPTRLLRMPTVSANTIAFAYANNIWTVERAGGAARRLTSFQGESSNPHFSPDGRSIAFSAEYAGNIDVYVVPAEGGEPKRLTWHPGNDFVQGWTPDGTSIMFSSSRASWAPSGAPRFWTVPAAGGVEQPMALPRGYQGKISADGTRIAYRMNNSWDDERRNYRGGQNRPIWIVDLKSYDLVSPPWTDSKDVDPVWVGNTVYFLSDRDGVANVWSYDTGSKKLAQVTAFKDFDVKSMDAGAGAIVFEQAGDIHELDPKSGKAHVVTITAAGDFPWMMPRWEDVTPRMTNLSLSPTGKRILAEARGEIFTIPAEKGDVRNLTHSSGSAERDPAWSPDGKYISYFSDKSGEYKLVIEEQDGLKPPREIALDKPTHYYTASWSPDSTKIMFTDTNLRVWVLDVASGKAKTIGSDPWMVPQRTLNPVWSPDSKWVAYSSHLKSLYHAIFVSNVETGETKQITDALADSVWPAWDASGKYLWFLASTNFGLASQWLDMTSYDREETFGLYFAVLKKGDPSPLLPESDEDQGVGASPAGGGGRGGRGGAPGDGGRGGASTEADSTATTTDEQPAARTPRTPVTVQIDFAGLQQRILSVPGVPERQYSRLRAGAAGTVYYMEAGTGGGRGGDGEGGGGSTLHRYRLSDRRAANFVTGVTDYSVSADGRKLLYRAAPPGGGRGRGGAAPPGPPPAPSLFIVDADRNPPAAGQGRVTATLRMYLEPRQEFAQIFHEGWRNQRDYLYVPNMHGVEWQKMKEMYGQLLPYVNHRADLNYLLDNMGAEISIGHSYVRGGAMPELPPSIGGLLGADFTIDASRYKIARIYDNESWNPDLRAPLSAPGVDVSVGDYVLAINGIDLRAPDNIHRLLDGTANRQTVLTVNSRPALDGARQITVVPVATEQALRTRAWVEQNRRTVEKLSDGQLAYVYLPNTGQPGYASFNRYYFSQQDKKGVVVDERYNGGGSAADYIIDVLQRDFDGYFNNVAGDRMPFTSPSAGIWGPKVMIINEMAGSGGDLMPYMFRFRKLGTLVGKRTWGGLVHTADTPTFVDGGSMIAPRGGFFTKDGKWAVENEGVAPDIDVENWPKDVIAGADPQLERAVQEAMRMLKEKPPARMTTEPSPPTWGKRKGTRELQVRSQKSEVQSTGGRMKTLVARSVLLSAIAAGVTATTVTAQSSGSVDAHVAAAKAAAGADFAGVFDRICREAAPLAMPAVAPRPAAARRVGPPPREEWHAEPVQVFDNLYFIGQTEYSVWAVKTSAGIILIDAIFDYSVDDEVVGGLKKLGLDPATIKYVVVSHGHSDHSGGAKYLQDLFNARIVLTAADWDLLDKSTQTKPRRDMVATDGQKLTLGDTTLTLYNTPGHTLGTISALIPVTDHGMPHVVATWGGTAFNWMANRAAYITPERPERFWFETYSASARRFKEITARAGADAIISNHTIFDGSKTKLPALAQRKPGDPHPYVIGKEGVQRYLTVVDECAQAGLAREK